jgi:rhamnosyltransferase subunit B
MEKPAGRRVVIATFGSFGDLNPCLGLALGLKARGHDPVIATSELYRPSVEGEGIAFSPVRPDLDPHDREAIYRIMDRRRGTEYLIRELLLPRLRESYEDLSEAARGAALLLTHPLTFAGPLLAEKARIPWVSTVLSPLSFFSAHDLPVLPAFPGLVGLRRLGPGTGAALIGLMKRATRSWTEPVRGLRADLGLPPGEDPLHEGQFSLDLVLAMFSRVLAEPRPDWPPRSRITGHVFYDGPGERGRLSPELDRFLRDGPAPVVFTLGTAAVGAAGPFFHESLEAARLLGVRAVLLVGDDPENLPPRPLPEGIAAFDHAPFSKLFPRARAVVHQGGIGTIGQALLSGRPQLVVPFAHDQPDNALRVEGRGVARVLYPRRYAARRAAERLGALLGRAKYARRAGEVAAQVRSEDGVGRACDTLEKVLADPERRKTRGRSR